MQVATIGLRLSRLFLVLFLAVGFNDCIAESWDLERVVKFAAENSPEVVEAKARVGVAEARLSQAWAAYSPIVAIQYGYSRTNNSMLAFGNILNQQSFSSRIDFNDVPTTDSISVRGVASLNLYSGGRDSAGVAAAKSTLAGSQFARSIVERDFALAAAINFLEIVRAKGVQYANQSAVQSFEASEKAIRARVLSGTAVRTELLDIQVQLESARDALVRANNGVELMVATLASLLVVDDPDFYPDTSVVAVPEPAFNLTDPLPLQDEERLASTMLDKSRSEIRGALAGYLPRISAQLSIEENRGRIFDGDTKSYVVGVLGEWTLWDGFSTRNKLREARDNLVATSEHEKRVRTESMLRSTRAKLRFREASEAAVIAGRAKELATESAKLTRARFSQGLATATQLIDSEHALTAAEVKLASATVDRQIAILQLRRAFNLLPLNDF